MRTEGVAVALVTMLAALALAAAGCGGGDDESSGASTTAAAAETTEPTTTAETTTGRRPRPHRDAGASSDDGLRGAGDRRREVLRGAQGTGQAPDSEATTAFFAELVDEAPDEIKDDLATLATAWAEIATALKDVDLSSGQAPSAETIAKLQELSTKFNTPALQQASTNLAEWTQEHCGTTTAVEGDRRLGTVPQAVRPQSDEPWGQSPAGRQGLVRVFRAGRRVSAPSARPARRRPRPPDRVVVVVARSSPSASTSTGRRSSPRRSGSCAARIVPIRGRDQLALLGAVLGAGQGVADALTGRQAVGAAAHRRPDLVAEPKVAGL